MKYVFMLFILVACSHHPKKEVEDDLVSVDAALDQAQASYLLGCVEAFKELKMPVSFPNCRDKSLNHRKELDSIMEQDL